METSKKGKYLPLSVYANQGFIIKDNEENCTDTSWDPVLGKTYCVNISSKEEGEIEREVRQDVTSFRIDLNKVMASQSRLTPRGKKRAIEDKTANSPRKKRRVRAAAAALQAAAPQATARPPLKKRHLRQQRGSWQKKGRLR